MMSELLRMERHVDMNILNVELSENAAEQIQKLCDTFQKPVKYFYDEQDDDLAGSGGAYYKVTLPSDLDRRTFEANILYELLHIRQFEVGFPTLCYKDSILFDKDVELVEGLGSSIFFGVLDIDVFERMRECRYIDAVYRFVASIFESLIEYASHVYGSLDDKYNFAHLVLDLAKILYHANPELDQAIREAYRGYPAVLEQAFKLRDMMHQNPPDAPDTAVVTMGILIDELELWDLFYIKIRDDKVRTKSEFDEFRENIVGQ